MGHRPSADGKLVTPYRRSSTGLLLLLVILRLATLHRDCRLFYCLSMNLHFSGQFNSETLEKELQQRTMNDISSPTSWAVLRDGNRIVHEIKTLLTRIQRVSKLSSLLWTKISSSTFITYQLEMVEYLDLLLLFCYRRLSIVLRLR